MAGDATTTRVDDILTRAIAGQRITDQEALILLQEGELNQLGQAADAIRNRKNDPRIVTYIVDRNINYTNICIYKCKFCAFYRKPGDPEGYLLSKDELRQKIQETVDLGGTGVLLQGGVHPDLPLEFYEDLLRWMSDEFPDVHRHAFCLTETHAGVLRDGVREGHVEEHRLGRLGRRAPELGSGVVDVVRDPRGIDRVQHAGDGIHPDHFAQNVDLQRPAGLRCQQTDQ